MLVAAQGRSALASVWGGGEVASADGMRFVVPVRSVHSGPNPKYFGVGRGVTWYNLISNQFSGLNDITVPGRSEEHTSELQSLMRISYAVFCLKKKKKQIE